MSKEIKALLLIGIVLATFLFRLDKPLHYIAGKIYDKIVYK